jgi:hypothetical protein
VIILSLQPGLGNSTAPSIVIGFGVQLQVGREHSCPQAFVNHKAMCEEPNFLTADPASHDEFARVVTQAAQATGTVVMTVASYEYAEGALVWYYYMQSKGAGGCVVVAMDQGSYTYLRNRGVPTVLIPTISHLNPCCLFRFKMVGWRATNDVKVCVASVPFVT